MDINDARNIIENIAIEVYGDIEEHYSGRFMYGESCLAITCEREKAEDVMALAISNGITNIRTDSMGKGVVVYFPELVT